MIHFQQQQRNLENVHLFFPHIFANPAIALHGWEFVTEYFQAAYLQKQLCKVNTESCDRLPGPAALKGDIGKEVLCRRTLWNSEYRCGGWGAAISGARQGQGYHTGDPARSRGTLSLKHTGCHGTLAIIINQDRVCFCQHGEDAAQRCKNSCENCWGFLVWFYQLQHFRCLTLHRAFEQDSGNMNKNLGSDWGEHIFNMLFLQYGVCTNRRNWRGKRN